MEESTERTIILYNPKKSFSFRVTVTEERKKVFEELMQSKGFAYNQISEHKQLALTINLDSYLREKK
jgi:hypothetical protein